MKTFLCTRRALLATTLMAASMATLPAWCQVAYPNKPVTLVVPNAAGGAADSLARAFGDELSKRLKQPVLVENLGGASGALAAQKVLRAAPDGYTLLFGTTSDMVVTPIANRSVNYGVRDFVPIAKVGTTPMTLVARADLGVSTADQLAALARQKPGKLSVGVTGNASLQALATVALQRAAKIDLLGVPYKGGAPVLTDLLGGQIDLAVLTLPAALGPVRSGKLVMLGVLAEQRAATAPDMPTINESQSFKGVSAAIWAGLAAPPGTPPSVVDRVSQVVKEVLSDQEFIDRRAKTGDTSVPFEASTVFGAFLATEEARYRELATDLKLE